MRRILPALLFFLFTLAIPATASAQLLSDKASVTLLTCGPGAELHSVFGHTAIRVYDPATAIDVVYNFGTFDFGTPNFYAKFVKGNLQYFVSASSYEDFVSAYLYYDRDVHEQVLNLTQVQKQAIADELNSTLLDVTKRYYTYKFIHRNCTTMVADILNKHLQAPISLENADNGMTYREIIFSRLDDHFFENLGINLAFGNPTDDVSSLLFLPNELMEGVSNTKTSLGPLEARKVAVNTASGNLKTPWWNNFYVYGAVCLLLMALSGFRTARLAYLAIAGLMGVFLTFLGFYSTHSELLYNYNALLLNPLMVVLVFCALAGRHKTTVLLAFICLACLVLYTMLIINKPHLFMMLPLIALTLIMHVRTLKLAKRHRAK